MNWHAQITRITRKGMCKWEIESRGCFISCGLDFRRNFEEGDLVPFGKNCYCFLRLFVLSKRCEEGCGNWNSERTRTIRYPEI